MQGPLDRVLIVMPSAIGDAVHVLPVVNSLKRHRAGTRITWVLQPGPDGLVRGHPAIDEVLVFERKRGWRGFADLRRQLAGRSFDIVLLLQPYLKAAIVAGLARAPVKIGIDRGRARDLSWLFTNRRLPSCPVGHIQDQYLEFLVALGVPPQLSWGLAADAAEAQRYAPLFPQSDRPVVALVLGTSKRQKEWPSERYADLVDRLGDIGAVAVLVGGRSERELAVAATIRRDARHQAVDALEWDLRKLAFFLERSDVVVSPDTGPLHMAVALNTPTVALMGYTNPKRFGPYRRFGELLVDAYGNPGEDYPPNAGHRPGRMERITPEMVLDKVMLALRSYPRRSRGGHPARA